jgi:hypothetical protein
MSREHRPRLRLVGSAAETGQPQPSPHRPVTPEPGPVAGLIVAGEVAHALGAASVMRMRADRSLTEYVCPFCELPGRIRHPTAPSPAENDDQAGAASVVALCYVNGLIIVRFAHPGCSPSAILRVLHDHAPTGHRVRAACWLRPASASTAGAGPGDRTAVLLVDNQVRAWDRARARLAEELYPQALRACGFAPWTDLAAVPPVVPGLTATITPLHCGPRDVRQPRASGAEAVLRVARRQAVVFDGCLDVPDAWAEAARTAGQVVVVAGTALTDPGPVIGRAWTADPDRLPDALAVAVGDGRVWAGVATLAPARPRRRRGGTDASPTDKAEDSPEPGTGIPERFPGISGVPDIPLPPNPAAAAQEPAPHDCGNVSATRTASARAAARWPWNGYRPRHSGGRRWA